LDDASTDGTWGWLKSIESKTTKIYRNKGPERIGHTKLYDMGAEIATNEIFGIFHADMIITPNYIPNILKHLKRGTIVCGTRIEPPLHPPGPEKEVIDFGMEPENFQEKEFLQFVAQKEIENKDRITNGIFAPWAMYKEDFFKIGGHDKRIFAPMELEDSLHENRILTVIENEKIKLIRFKNLFEKYIHLIETRSDGKEIIDFDKNKLNIRSSTAQKFGIIGSSKISKLIRKKCNKPLLKIRTTWGETICTKDHSLIDKNLNPIRSGELNINTMWRPKKMGDWTRRYYYKKIDFNTYIKNFIPINNRSKSHFIDHLLPVVSNIDTKGTNTQLRNICEFLGFFVAKGSTTKNYIKFDNNNLEILEEFKEKAKSLVPTANFKLRISKKINCKDVYSYVFGSVKLSKFIMDMVGKHAENKKVPDFIFNLPKPYQQSFLYGYLQGDGYLGTSVIKNNISESICINKKLIFKREIFEMLDCKFTTISDILASGIIFLLRNNYPNLSINLDFDKIKKCYNIFTNKSPQDKIMEIENFEEPCEYVYDIEMNNYGEHTFIDSMGCFGVHNSDIFNRFLLNGYEFFQSRDAFVYHLTCRGSRFKDGVKIVQEIPVGNNQVWKKSEDSAEYTKLRQIKFREWWRKWHMDVLHDSNMLPIVNPRYNIGFVIDHCSLQLLPYLEPWCDTIYTDIPEGIVSRYINDEQKISKFNIKNRVKSLSDNKVNDILVSFDGRRFGNNHFNFIKQLPLIIQDSAEVGEMEYDIFKLIINKISPLQDNLINCDNPWYISQLQEK
jgi:hypothetical protein